MSRPRFVLWQPKIAIALLCTLCFWIVPTHAAGELDTSFSGTVYGNPNVLVSAVRKQSDGKILVGGLFSAANSTPTSGLIRLNGDGSVDPSFNTIAIFSGFGIGAWVTAINVQPDGKIVVGGNFLSPIGQNQPGVRRLNPDGSIDGSFTSPIFNAGSIVHDIEFQADGKILAAGNFSGAGLPESLIRLNTNGTVDPSFAGQPSTIVKDIDIQPDGSVLMVGNPTQASSTGILRRLTTTGLVDASFPAAAINGTVEAVKLKPNGQILIGGMFTSINGFTCGRIALFNSNGTLDLTFNQNNPGFTSGFAISVNDIELDANGKIVAGGRFQAYNSVLRRGIARLNADGSLDTSFADNSLFTDPSGIVDLDILPNGKVVVGVANNIQSIRLMQFNADGSVDTAFNAFLSLSGVVRKVAYLPDGKIAIGGDFPYVNGARRAYVARLNADGTPDTSFVPYTNTTATSGPVRALAFQPDGKIIIGMQSVGEPVRLNTDGSRDLSFTAPSVGDIRDIVVLSNGQILVASGAGGGIRKLNSNGTIDASFLPQVTGVLTIHVQSDGKILIGGSFTQVGATLRGRIARLHPNGALDDSFNPPGGANGTVEDIDVETNGKILIGGDFGAVNGVDRLRVARFFPDGTLDSTFVQTADGVVRSIESQADGKVLIGGSFGFVQSQSRVGLARLNANGSLDAAFNGRPNTAVYDITFQADGKILIGGEFILVNGAPAMRVARLLNAAAPVRTLFDYDGDSKSDISVFRPSENKWYIFRSSDSVITQQIFAIAGDVPAPADYDGDQKTDMAIYRPSQGGWWYLSTADGQPRFAQLGGEAGDVPRPSDFDGDGRADFIIFRPSNSTWYRISSGNGATSTIQFGLAGDKPVTGDFDGDGKSDVAIYRPSSGDWWYQSSINNAQLATHFGISTDIPTPADFDGDGRTDFAVYRPSTGVWYILNSSNGSATIMAFGISEDRPVAADYDGDGKADIAVFRPSTGVWYLMRSTAGFTAMQFGISTDIPTENAFVP